MKELNAAAPDKPFFLYYVPGGSHSPHQPKPEWSAKFKGKFDMGWNALREQIFANQKRLGVIPAHTQLTPWPNDLPKVRPSTPKARTSSLAGPRCSPPTPPTSTTRPAW